MLQCKMFSHTRLGFLKAYHHIQVSSKPPSYSNWYDLAASVPVCALFGMAVGCARLRPHACFGVASFVSDALNCLQQPFLVVIRVEFKLRPGIVAELSNCHLLGEERRAVCGEVLSVHWRKGEKNPKT